MWGIFEVFVATLLVCSVTALVILTSGVYQSQQALAALESGVIPPELLGAPLSAAAFATVLGRAGSALVTVCLLLFAFTSLLGWSYYGERGLSFLTHSQRWIWPYRLLFLVSIPLGAAGDLAAVWQMADIFNALMALPNLSALLLLSPQALDLWARWVEREKGWRGVSSSGRCRDA